MVNLTSDTDAIACNAEGAPIATGVLAESTAELYFANVKQTEGVSFKYTPLNCTISELQNATGKIEVTGITQDTASVDVAVSYKSKTLYITYSLLKVKGTAVYRLVPSSDVIKRTYNRQSDSYSVAPSLLTCGVTRSEQDKVETMSALPSGYTMLANDKAYTLNSNFNVDGSTNVTFVLKNGKGQVVDREVIPVVSDGKDGKNAYSINLTNDSDVIACKADGSPSGSGTLATTTAELYLRM